MGKEPRQLLERMFGLAEQRRNIWLASADEDVLEDDITNHNFWAHVARMLRPSDEIIVIPASNEWRMHLYVIRVDSVGADVAVLSKHDFREMASAALDAAEVFTIRWRGPHAQYGVVRRDTGEVIKDGFATKDAAREFLRDTSMAA